MSRSLGRPGPVSWTVSRASPSTRPHSTSHPAFARDGLEGVPEEVQDHLLEPRAVEGKERQGLAHGEHLQVHAGGLSFGSEEPRDILGEGEEGDRLVVGPHGPGEEEEIAHQGFQPLDLLADDPGQGGHFGGELRVEPPGLALHARELEADGVQGVAHLVGQARGEGPKGGHLLALHDVRLRVLQLLKGPTLRLAVAGRLDPEGDLVADRLEEEQRASSNRWPGRAATLRTPRLRPSSCRGMQAWATGAVRPSSRSGMRGHWVVLWASIRRPVSKTSWQRHGSRPFASPARGSEGRGPGPRPGGAGRRIRRPGRSIRNGARSRQGGRRGRFAAGWGRRWPRADEQPRWPGSRLRWGASSLAGRAGERPCRAG